MLNIANRRFGDSLRRGRFVGGAGDLLSRITFANASPRYVVKPDTGAVVGPFPAGIPAIVTINGRRFVSVWTALTNHLLNGATMSDWTTTMPNDSSTVIDPLGLTGARRLTTVPDGGGPARGGYRTYNTPGAGAGVFSYFYRVGSGVVQSKRYSTAATYETVTLVSGVWKREQIYGVGDYAFIYHSSDGDGGTGRNNGDYHYYWCCQIGIGKRYAGRPILTTGSALTTAKDQVRIDAALLPAALRDKCRFPFYTCYADTQLGAGVNRTIAYYADSGTDGVEIYLSGTDKRVHLAINGVDSILSDALTWSAGDQLKSVYLDRISGTMRTEGFTTGNSQVAGSAWNQPDGLLRLGMDGSEANQIDGLVTLERY